MTWVRGKNRMPITPLDIATHESIIEGVGAIDKQLHAAMIALFQAEPQKILKRLKP